MLVKTVVSLTYLVSVASATFGPLLEKMPHCWKKCARQAGLACHWEDVACLCKAANNGFLVKANTCACSTCSDWAFGNDDKAKVQLKGLAGVCKFTSSPLDQSVTSAAFQAATCEGSGSSSPPSPHPPQVAPPPAWPPSTGSLAPKNQPDSHPAPANAPAGSSSSGSAGSSGSSDSPAWASPPSGSPPSGSPPFSSTQPYSATLTISLPAKPTIAPGPPAAVIPPPAAGSPSRSWTKPASAGVSSPYASKTWVGAAGNEYESTVVQQSTVLVVPTPVQSGALTGATAATKAVASGSKTGKPAAFTGAAVRPDLRWGGSMMAWAAGLIVVVA
ncbi:hypothetical protein EJ08DRAFT_662388 [Tothia fuscella]|uniref:Extracellular membrane protein CFEM domain-containing protein n=1 Tax=Tothia fuscella TaxID=1048955 RepID=A0A9P4NN62_9PEZI|nr:hypothetical protein EJ08DRAFT_662388 [Tothia fuscella]